MNFFCSSWLCMLNYIVWVHLMYGNTEYNQLVSKYETQISQLLLSRNYKSAKLFQLIAIFWACRAS